MISEPSTVGHPLVYAHDIEPRRSPRNATLGGNQRSLDTVGVGFTWPLFQGGAVASAVRQSRARYHQAEALYDSAQRETERLTRSAYRPMS